MNRDIRDVEHEMYDYFSFPWYNSPSEPGPPRCWCFTITFRHTTLGRSPLDKWSARHRDLLPDNTQHSQQTDIHVPSGIRIRNSCKLAAADHCLNLLTPTGHVMHQQFNIQRLYVLPTLYLCFVFIWEQTATCATYSINWLVFITEMKSVYRAVRIGSLNKAVCASSLKG